MAGARDHSQLPNESITEKRAIGAIVIGGEYRGLGIVRSLGRRGIPVCVLTDDQQIAAHSRYARHVENWPNAKPPECLNYLVTLARRLDLTGWVLFPTGDETTALVSRHCSELSSIYRLTTPTWPVLRWAYDKRETYELAIKADVDSPFTFIPNDRSDVERVQLQFPVILKPAVKETFNEFTHAKAWRVDDRQTLLERYDAAAAVVRAETIMIQELIPGSGVEQFSFAALCDRGRAIASVTARRTRQYPIDFGRASTFVETIDQPAVEMAATKVIMAMQHSGLIEVEFKRDPRDGKLKLLDLNPRVWGWHSLGAKAGVDFPYLAWKWAQGQSIEESHSQPGVSWMRLVTDVMAVAQQIRRGTMTPRSYFRSFQSPIEFATLALDDPIPAIVDIPLLCLLALRRRAF